MQNIGNIAVYSGSVQRPDFRASVYSAAKSSFFPSSKKDETDSVSISEKAKSLQYRGLSEDEIKEVEQLKKRDREVRTHEEAHMRVGGDLVDGPFYDYTKGPDNRVYVTGGSVSIDTSPVADDPAATIRKMQRVRNAALAPVDPSPQDRRVASEATRTEATARAELRETENSTITSIFESIEQTKSTVPSSQPTNEDSIQVQPTAISNLSQRSFIRDNAVDSFSFVSEKQIMAFYSYRVNIAV